MLPARLVGMTMFGARLRHCQRRSPAAAKVPSGPIHSRRWAEDSAVRAQPPASRWDASLSLNELPVELIDAFEGGAAEGSSRAS